MVWYMTSVAWHGYIWLALIIGTPLVEMAISSNEMPVIWIDRSDNTKRALSILPLPRWIIFV